MGQNPAPLAVLRAAYRAGDIKALCEAWRLGCVRDVRLRMVERVYPVSRLLELASALDRQLARHGLIEAARWLLDTYTPGWRVVVPEHLHTLLSAAPVLLYGNHPSLLTPFLVAASVGREDLRVVSASFVERLVPNYSAFSLTVEPPLNRWWAQLRRDGLRRVLVTWLLVTLHGSVPDSAVKQANREALKAAANHVCAGGCTMIAPGGGGRREPRWYRGLGVVLRGISDTGAAGSAFLVPYAEEHRSDFLLTGVLRANAGRRVASTQTGHGLLIRFGEAEPVSAYVTACAAPERLVHQLHERYRGSLGRGTSWPGRAPAEAGR